MKSATTRLRRCAVYTRKSSEEGLEQDFNSLDAQHEACAAYVASQAGEGWRGVNARYDDGGYSGGNLERPALHKLMADIEAGRIDTVVVYKVDRLTRSLADFAKLVELFDAHGVSFVSVTQAFNTTTSMGRLTLNMLLSFAQFEREVTGERIRDKIAASKKKGLWMGGFVPLGYEPRGRTLVINETEAETVRSLFRLYLEYGNVRRVKAQADRRGLVTKIRPTAGGHMRGGRPLSRGHIYKLLANPLYIGRIPHKGESHEGLHPAIIDAETWQAVQAGLASNTPSRSASTGYVAPSPLGGKLFDEGGVPLSPSHAVKAGRRYRYYVSRRLIAARVGDGEVNTPGWRLPAREIERLAGNAVEALLADRASFVHAARDSGMLPERIPGLLRTVAGKRRDPLQLVERVELGQDSLTFTLTLCPLTGKPEDRLRHSIPLRIRRRGVEMRLVLADTGARGASPPDAALIKAIARAHRWFEELTSGRAQSLADIAQAEGVSPRYVGQVIRLAFLAPDITRAVLAGKQPPHLTAETLLKRTRLPIAWEEQKTSLRFT